MNREQQKTFWRWLVATVLLVAAALRFYGLTWGLPSPLHAYSYHPDEFLTVGTAFNIFSKPELNPHFYNYPTLYIYLCALAQALVSLLGFTNDFTLHLASRLVCVLMGVGAVAVCYFGCLRHGKIAGIVGGVYLALTAVHVQHSHFATVDVPSTLFVAGCLVSALAAYRTGSIKWIIASGVLAGLAAGTKYNAGIVALSAVAAPLFLAKLSVWQRVQRSALVAVLTVAAFVLSTPGTVLYTGEFLRGLKYELAHSSQGHGLVFLGVGNPIIYAFKTLSWAMGPVLLLIAVFSVVFATLKKRNESLILLAFLVPYFLLMVHSQVKFVRYAIPLLPVFAIYTALAAGELQNYKSFTRQIAAGVGIVSLLATVAYCIGVVALFGKQDTRDCAAEKLSTMLAPGQSIGFIDLPWFYSPPLEKMLGYGTTQTRRQALERTYPYLKMLEDISPNEPLPELVCVSDYEIDDALRLRGNQTLPADARAERDQLLSAYNVLQKEYLLTETCSHKMLWIDASLLPHDMRYVSPRLDIYKLKR